MRHILAPIVFLVINFFSQWLAAGIYDNVLRKIFPPYIFIIFLAFHVIGILWLIISFSSISGMTKVEFSLLIILLILVTFLVFHNNLNYYKKFNDPLLNQDHDTKINITKIKSTSIKKTYSLALINMNY